MSKYSKSDLLKLAGAGIVAVTVCTSGCGSDTESEKIEPATSQSQETIATKSSESAASNEPAEQLTVLNEVYEDEELVDDEGNHYTLHYNEDGSETATYENGENVTFRRDDSGNLNFMSGSMGLLGGLAAGYFLFHGLNPSHNGHISNNRYVYGGRPTVVSESTRKDAMKRYSYDKDKRGAGATAVTRAGNKSSGTQAVKPNSSTSSSSAKSKSSVSTPNTAKGGFGSAGARSASS